MNKTGKLIGTICVIVRKDRSQLPLRYRNMKFLSLPFHFLQHSSSFPFLHFNHITDIIALRISKITIPSLLPKILLLPPYNK